MATAKDYEALLEIIYAQNAGGHLLDSLQFMNPPGLESIARLMDALIGRVFESPWVGQLNQGAMA